MSVCLTLRMVSSCLLLFRRLPESAFVGRFGCCQLTILRPVIVVDMMLYLTNASNTPCSKIYYDSSSPVVRCYLSILIVPLKSQWTLEQLLHFSFWTYVFHAIKISQTCLYDHLGLAKKALTRFLVTFRALHETDFFCPGQALHLLLY